MNDEPERDWEAEDTAERAGEGAYREVFLIIRPEEKRAVERTLQSLVGSAYVSLPALGRGGSGAPSPARPGWLSWVRARAAARSACLPKAMFFLVLPREDVDELLAAVGATLRSERGPSDAGQGIGVVVPLHAAHDISGAEGPDEERSRR